MDYKQKLKAFLRIASQLVNRFEQLAPDVDGKTDRADVRLIKAFRAKRDELSQTLQGAEPARKSRNKR
jgi:ABC-type transporter Mla subunit MlaD